MKRFIIAITLSRLADQTLIFGLLTQALELPLPTNRPCINPGRVAEPDT